MSKVYFVTGIGTGIGKTVISSVLTEKLHADYWKPVQAGELENSDSLLVKKLITNDISVIHPETYRLSQPYSPHYAAELDNVKIDLKKFALPVTLHNLVIEGAGGIMVPLNEDSLILDLIVQLRAEVILVADFYLGSINHTLLSIKVLQNAGVVIKGIIFNGEINKASMQYILQYTKIDLLGVIPFMQQLNKETIRAAGDFITL